MTNLLARLRGQIFKMKCRLFRKNISIGKGLKVYKKICIQGKGRISIGQNCIIGGVKGDTSQYVTIDTHSDDACIRIQDNVGLYAARISAKYEIIVGNDVLIEEAGVVDTDFHSIEKSRRAPENESRERCRIVIGDRVSIGARSFIMKGVKIGDDVTVIPGSVVSTSVNAGSVVCGNPARAVKIEG